MSLQCYILSGVSGAGKTTWIQKQPWAANADIHSADHFFVQADGSYLFDWEKLPEAHHECLRRFLRGIRNGYHAKSKGAPLEGMAVQVVDNTNLTSEEIAPFYASAKAHGYEVTLVNLLVPPELAAARNRHNVPLATIKKMQEKMHNRVLPSFWKLNVQNYTWTKVGWVQI